MTLSWKCDKMYYHYTCMTLSSWYLWYNGSLGSNKSHIQPVKLNSHPSTAFKGHVFLWSTLLTDPITFSCGVFCVPFLLGFIGCKVMDPWKGILCIKQDQSQFSEFCLIVHSNSYMISLKSIIMELISRFSVLSFYCWIALIYEILSTNTTCGLSAILHFITQNDICAYVRLK